MKTTKNNAVMIDIETLDTTATSLVVQIAACRFNRHEIDSESKPHKVLELVVPYLDSIVIGRTVSKDTADFWSKQTDKSLLARAMTCEVSVREVMARLREFLEAEPYEEVWSKSPNFDISILNNLAQAVGIDLGIPHKKERDVRTEMADYPQFDEVYISKLQHPGALSKHNAIYDVLVQIRIVQEIYACKFSPSVEESAPSVKKSK